MGAFGSGPVPKYVFDDKMISNIKKWRAIGHSWSHIADRLGMRSETPLEKFRKENPEIDLECGEALLNLESVLIQDIVKLVRKLCADGKSPPPDLIKMLMTYLRVFQKEENNVVNAIQVNGGAATGLQVTFVKPEELQKKNDTFEMEARTIDADKLPEPSGIE